MGNEGSTTSSNNSYSDSNNGASTETYYHYTDDKGAQGIADSKMIYASTDTNKDAVYGQGTYFTSKDPHSNSKTDIAINNYDDSNSFVVSNLNDGKLDNVVEVQMPSDHVVKADSSRDVYVYNGDVDLNEYEYNIYQNPNK